MRVQDSISSKLKAALAPLHLEVINESHNHSVGPGAETHFKVLIVSESFVGISRIARQQRLYQILDEELKSGVHALTQRCLTPEEWERGIQKFESPKCHGGAKREGIGS